MLKLVCNKIKLNQLTYNKEYLFFIINKKSNLSFLYYFFD